MVLALSAVCSLVVFAAAAFLLRLIVVPDIYLRTGGAMLFMVALITGLHSMRHREQF